jgi:hypothetical protein
MTSISPKIPRFLIILFMLFFLASSMEFQKLSALPAGFQEFYTPLPADLTQDIFVNIDNDPAVSNGMHYVVEDSELM